MIFLFLSVTFFIKFTDKIIKNIKSKKTFEQMVATCIEREETFAISFERWKADKEAKKSTV